MPAADSSADDPGMGLWCRLKGGAEATELSSNFLQSRKGLVRVDGESNVGEPVGP